LRLWVECDIGKKTMSRVFEAIYKGECSECGNLIEVGDDIRYNEFHEIVRVECCGDEDDDTW